MAFETKVLPVEVDATAPDGSGVRLLLALDGGSVAHFALTPDQTSVAVRHRTVEEIWFVLRGTGEMWRSEAGRESVVAMTAGTCVSIPIATAFQFRCIGNESLEVVGVTMPPWPGDGEAVRAEGPWTPTIPSGPGLA
jgi:mannose-6-phosphate isomerase-like protein (cupin superfamily)